MEEQTNQSVNAVGDPIPTQPVQTPTAASTKPGKGLLIILSLLLVAALSACAFLIYQNSRLRGQIADKAVVQNNDIEKPQEQNPVKKAHEYENYQFSLPSYFSPRAAAASDGSPAMPIALTGYASVNDPDLVFWIMQGESGAQCVKDAQPFSSTFLNNPIEVKVWEGVEAGSSEWCEEEQPYTYLVAIVAEYDTTQSIHTINIQYDPKKMDPSEAKMLFDQILSSFKLTTVAD